jgi:hypothetical protein
VHTVYRTPRIQIQRIPNPTHPDPPSNLPHSNIPHPQSTTSAVHHVRSPPHPNPPFPNPGLPLQSSRNTLIRSSACRSSKPNRIPVLSECIPGPHPVPTALSSPLPIQRIPIQSGCIPGPVPTGRTLFSALGLFSPLPDIFLRYMGLASPAVCRPFFPLGLFLRYSPLPLWIMGLTSPAAGLVSATGPYSRHKL